MNIERDRMEIVAKHLANEMGVQIEFVKDATPATDGRRIILPTELNGDMLFELLGALLHETAHVRYTDKNAYERRKNQTEQMREAVNVLEDIRVDAKAIAEHPAAQSMYRKLLTYISEKYGEGMKKEPLAHRIFKHLVLIGKGLEDLAYDDKAMKAIEILNLRHFVVDAIDATDTYTIEALAEQLLRVLGQAFKDEQEKAKKESREKAQKGQGQASNEQQQGDNKEEGTEKGEGNAENEDDKEGTKDEDGEGNGEGQGTAENGEGEGTEDGEAQDNNKEGNGEDEDGEKTESGTQGEGDTEEEGADEDDWYEPNPQYADDKKNAEKDFEKAQDKYEEKQAKSQEKMQKARDLEAQREKARKNQRMNDTRVRRAEYRAKYAEKNGMKDMQAEQEKIAASAKRLVEKHSKKQQDVMQPLSQAVQEYQEAKNERDQARREYDEKNRRKVQLQDDTSLESLLGRPELEFGLKAIAEDLKAPTPICKMPKTLDDVLRDFFVARREEKTEDDSGRLNNRKLSHLFTDGNSLFYTTEVKERRTKVAFVIDKSGSMLGQRMEMLRKAMGTLWDALRRVINECNLPVDVSVYAFDYCHQEYVDGTTKTMEGVYKVKDETDEMDGETLASKLIATDSGTDLVLANLKVAQELDSDGTNAEKVMVVLTDAEVTDYTIQEVINSTRTDIKSLYIGIDAAMEKESVKRLFAGHNITPNSDIVDVLSRALREAITQ